MSTNTSRLAWLRYLVTLQVINFQRVDVLLVYRIDIVKTSIHSSVRRKSNPLKSVKSRLCAITSLTDISSWDAQESNLPREN